jgi:hypothetical protein
MGGVREDGLNWWLGLLAWRTDWIAANLGRIGARRRATAAERDSHDAILNHGAMLGGVGEAAASSSCGLACGSLCCYFPKDSISAQVEVEKAGRIRSWLAGKGLGFEDHVRELRWEDIHDEYKRFLSGGEYAFKRDGVWRVYEVANGGSLISPKQASSLPRLSSGLRMWTGPDSRACRFLGEDGLCALQAEGLKPSICSDFVCSTVRTLAVAEAMGVLRGRARSLSFREQNMLADRLLAAFDSGRFRRLELSHHSAFIDLAEAYADGRDLGGRPGRYRKAREEYFSGRAAIFERAVSPGWLERLIQLFS